MLHGGGRLTWDARLPRGNVAHSSPTGPSAGLGPYAYYHLFQVKG